MQEHKFSDVVQTEFSHLFSIAFLLLSALSTGVTVSIRCLKKHKYKDNKYIRISHYVAHVNCVL